ncbi:hypothetical protein J2W35_003308 [Variovorax boronicumulans]|uniref:DUF6950 family protein n=1 Tax=Variovorax boronicumulans TaxID=436515 RepID=UPI0027814107|nr:hypothetical protein [Variovorax boronicumulans]MDQ0082949.1 hypothetical protein [Variovorax boronicumulans]
MRLKDWQQRFSDFGKARASMPFAWGSNDCCTFAAAAVEAISGVNPMADVERYSTEVGALRRIAEAGDLKALAAAHLGEPVSQLLAGVGDVVLVMNEGREMLGICNGVNVMAPGEFGMVALGMDAALAAWKI